MKIARSWLEELLPELPSTEEVVGHLDALGLSVEAVLTLAAAPAGVRVAEVVGLRPLPSSSHLQVAEVHDGVGRFEVVSGAPNLAVGLRTAFAPPGTRLAAGDLVVGRREVLGVGSQGMLCSPRELGLFDHAGGLLELGGDAPVGAALEALWPAETVFELELTPNRADAFSLLGVARDLSALLRRPLAHPAGAEALDPGDTTLDDGLRLEVEDLQRCPRFTLRRVDAIELGPSPLWLQRRLAAAGARPRNAVVDVTNYVTFELGQPSHAYDLRALRGGVLQVRRARAGERLITLADEELELDPDDLVIATPAGGGGSRAVGLAGVIGGRDDSVREHTTSLALEVAHFAPPGVRRSARRHRLTSEAHHRFERGVDPNLPPLASARAVALIAELTQGRVHPGVSAVGSDALPPAVAFRPERVAFLIGLEVPRTEQRRSLEALGCQVAAAGGERWSVTPPSWRFDLAIEEDLIEEVVRLRGYHHIGESVPAMDFVPPPSDPTHRRLREALVGLGLLETIGYVFSGEEELRTARAPEPRVRLSEPQGIERAVLRTALYPGLLAAARSNHAAPDLSLFEIGRVFGADERERLGLLLRGRRLGAPWRAGLDVDFFVVKGVLEQLAEGFRADLEVAPGSAPHLHPGASARVGWNGREVGTLGRLHPEVAAAFELGEVYLAELDLPLEPTPPALSPVPRQPFAERDLSVVVPGAHSYAAVRDAARAAAGPELVSLEPFDVYVGAQVGEGRKSLALRFRFRHHRRALTDAEVDGRMKDIIESLAARGYSIRT